EGGGAAAQGRGQDRGWRGRGEAQRRVWDATQRGRAIGARQVTSGGRTVPELGRGCARSKSPASPAAAGGGATCAPLLSGQANALLHDGKPGRRLRYLYACARPSSGKEARREGAADQRARCRRTDRRQSYHQCASRRTDDPAVVARN